MQITSFESVEVLDANLLPAPDALVACHDGQVMPTMFFYAIEGANFKDIASEYGFDSQFQDELGHSADDADVWWKAYEADPAAVLTAWQPVVPEGWRFGGKWHSEDGIAACFLRKRVTP